ncbi:MAG TPA: cytochrome c oxidase subunit II [Terriglobales bacterium]|nr:cytochrome c oxidase subunit II [Terriglobales bacterium]
MAEKINLSNAVLCALFALWSSGCDNPQSTLYPKGPAASKIAHMSWLMLILFLAITVFMWVLLSIAFIRRRGSLAEHAPVDVGGGHGWVLGGGLVLPLIVLCVLFVLGLRLMSAFPMHAGNHQQSNPEIEIIGHQWWWEVHYLGEPSQQFITANEIHIPVGRPVNIELRSGDVIHSFWVPTLHGKVDLVPGMPNFISVEASQPGTYRGTCAEYCGAQHAHMRLLVVAQGPEDYEAWIQGQLKPGAEPQTEAAKNGQQLFLSGPCASCHQVRGTLAGGSVAPNLTHFASRQMIAGNSYPNNEAYLEAWITHAQSLKPEAQMPDLTQFSGRQLRDIVAYLRQLQ